MKFKHLQIPPLRWIIVLLPLIGAFFYVPLAFGGVTPETVMVLDILLAVAAGLWILLLIYRKRLPSISPLCLISLLVLVLLGVAYALNPHSFHRESDWKLIPLFKAIKWLPGSVDRDASVPVLLNLGALLLAGLVMQDAVASSKARWLLFRAIALSGFVIALIGIIQKADGQEAMLWVTPERSGSVFFAAFRYHANAASFLNLSWPAAFAVWMRSRTKDPGGILSSLDFCVLFFVIAAVFVNTSKAGHLLGLVGLVATGWRFRSELKPRNISRAGAVVLGVLLTGMLAVVLLPAIFSSIEKWKGFAADGGSLRGRLEAYEVCLQAIPASGIFGTGAGTFRYFFHQFSAASGGEVSASFWYHAHQDWLQGIIEWGYLGFAAWLVLFGGAFLRHGKRVREARENGHLEISSSVSLIALTLVLAHSMVDFPLQIPAIQLLVVFYLAVGWVGPTRVGTSGAQKSPPEAG